MLTGLPLQAATEGSVTMAGLALGMALTMYAGLASSFGLTEEK